MIGCTYMVQYNTRTVPFTSPPTLANLGQATKRQVPLRLGTYSHVVHMQVRWSKNTPVHNADKCLAHLHVGGKRHPPFLKDCCCPVQLYPTQPLPSNPESAPSMSVYVITGVSRGIGVSLPHLPRTSHTHKTSV